VQRKSLKNEKLQSIQVADIDVALDMLKRYVVSEEIRPLLHSLEALRTDPRNEARQQQVADAFGQLGHLQGAALTYAPYLHIFVSDDPFAD